jgi:hypothetical protein
VCHLVCQSTYLILCSLILIGDQHGCDLRFCGVGDAGFEPTTPSVSRKCSPTELIALAVGAAEVETGFEPVWTALQAAASPLGHSTEVRPGGPRSERTTGLEPATFTLAR